MLQVNHLPRIWYSKEAAALWTDKKTPLTPAIINECLSGHLYEAHPVTREFHAIKRDCALCNAPLRTVLIVSSPSGPEGGPPAPAIGASEWTLEKPTRSGWYWYHEAGKNQDRPMRALVFETRAIRYASRFAAHELQSFRDPHRVEECPGSWVGPSRSLR